ncbi:MAG: GNAT family N-acetyltransferase [Ardenticatenaceae bacterium]|nr:GNAT family N-acetyltransferase [Ardenticatenaceae bacterium]
MEIRAYRAADAAKLCQLHHQIWGETITAVDLHDDLLSYEHLRVGVVAGEVVGYTAVSTVPGLPQVRVLRGFIAPPWQRQGLGSQLLRHLMGALRVEIGDWRLVSSLQSPLSTLQLSYCVDDVHSAVAHFLRSHNFYIEHEEQHLILASPPLSPSPPPAPLSLATLSRSPAVAQFIKLYDASFGPHPWYQPYTRGEVAASLYRAQDLLFLYHREEPIGFAWTRLMAGDLGEIEPIGIVDEWQGRGYGRFLLQSAIHTLSARGANEIHIGTWASNKPALHLYHSLGFVPDHTLTYLAYDVTAAA